MIRSIIIGFVLFFLLQVKAQNIYTFAGTGSPGFSGDGGSALSAQIANPVGIAIDLAGNFYFCDSGNKLIRKIDASGIITTIGGGGTSTVEGVPATTAIFGSISAITVDALGTVYFTETAPDRVRKISPSGIVNTIAGSAAQGFSGDGGPAISATLYNPSGITVDAAGNIYISDSGNNRIRMINTAGIINTIAGIGTNGFSGDGGQASLAQLYSPAGIILGTSGKIIFADLSNHRIREINSSGIINTIAGNGSPGYSGDSGPATSAQLRNPLHLVLDVAGNLYFTESWFSIIRKVDNSNLISTASGSAGIGYAGDGGPASSAKLSGPAGIVMDASGNLYFADSGNHRIRIICLNACAMGMNDLYENSRLYLYPNPSTGQVRLSLTNNSQDESSKIEVINPIGQIVLKIPFSNSIDVSGLSQGIYTLKLISKDQKIHYSKFVKE
jgi:trimeric autotransporter adhesin